MRSARIFIALFISMCLGCCCIPAHAQSHNASGDGTYFVGPGIRSEFQFNESQVQCKVGHTVLPGGIDFQMFMYSTAIDSVSIDSTAQTAVITGTMVSTVNLRFPGGAAVTLTETVPILAYAEDNGTTGAGPDYFALTVIYRDTPGFDQFDLFGSPATFAGVLDTGNIEIR